MSTGRVLNDDRIEPLIVAYRDGLLDDTLAFWFPRCVDEECGGFLIARNRDGSLLDDDKGVWQQGRATWLLYFTDVKGLPVQEYWHDMKFWWPHNEAIIATLLAWQLTGDGKYARWHQLVHDWAYGHFPDPEHGEWYGYLHRDGRVSVPLKGNLWKGPFHLPRMQLICWKALERE